MACERLTRLRFKIGKGPSECGLPPCSLCSNVCDFLRCSDKSALFRLVTPGAGSFWDIHRLYFPGKKKAQFLPTPQLNLPPDRHAPLTGHKILLWGRSP